MRIGVDFGTTRTIAATVDRGNYPVVSFEDSAGDTHEYFPSVVARNADGQLCYGFDALEAAAKGAPLVRSIKRALTSAQLNADTTIEIGGKPERLLFVLTGFLRALRTALSTKSNLYPTEDFEAVIAVPAHASGAQRFLTLEAFRLAGFAVTAMLNEPSAAGFEYTHHRGHTVNSKRSRLVVYDLGGGTFDASLINVEETSHEVLANLGLNNVGGDDFDVVLAECAAREAGITIEQLSSAEFLALVDECRTAKEQIVPQTKRIPIEMRGQQVTVAVADFYEAATPLVESTIEAMRPIIGQLEVGTLADTNIVGIYLVGGASGLPLVPRLLREHFGRRVHRSPYPAASTAIGLAIAADETSDFRLSDRLSRGFGVFREGESGRHLRFDQIFTPDAAVPERGEVVIRRRYRAAHNVGWFRFVEYTAVDMKGEPVGEIAPYGDIVFPFDEDLVAGPELREVPVERREGGPLVEERYAIDQNGIVTVWITNLSTGYVMKAKLGAPDQSV